MKTIIAISDSHRNIRALKKLLNIMNENDYVFHLGDNYDDMNYLELNDESKLYKVAGNCDMSTNKEIILEIEGHRLLLVHGDLFGVKTGLEKLKEYAKEKNCDIVLYGHTHSAKITKEDNIQFINVGSLSAMSFEQSYVYLILSKEKVVAKICHLI